MSSISIGRLLTRGWMLLVAVVVVAVAGFCAKHVGLRLSGCRIIIDGAVKDERSVKTLNAYTFCLDTSG